MTATKLVKLALIVPLFSGAVALAELKEDVQKLADEFASSFNKGDVATLVKMYADDAKVLPPDEEVATGQQGISQLWTAYAKGAQNLKLTVLDAESLGPDSIVETGTYTLETRAQPAQQGSGKYMVVWRKVGNEWRIYRDTFNVKTTK